MERPINVFWDFIRNLKDLVVSVKIGNSKADPFGSVLEQLSDNTFKVKDNNGNIGICTLVSKDTDKLKDNEMSLYAICLKMCSSVFIKKVINDIMIDFKNNNYKWELDHDSTQSIVLLRDI